MKVAHHGSADQDAALYELADAAVALVTVGADNDYGHPRDETLDVSRAARRRVARTDVAGDRRASGAAASGVAVWRERGSDVARAG